MRPKKNYYVTGGSLRSDTPSYVARKADEELFEALQGSEFCYVLTSRQMGKTSLIVRTATRLRAENVRTAVLDLTAIGQNVLPEQWYYGLLCRLGEQLGLEDEFDDFWLEHERLGPLQRWMAAIHEAALLPDTAPLVIFIDEIDAVRSLPISTGEFFAAIRECYNRRPQDKEFDRLTFCLVGVASPTDLIRDTRTTPFNIGRRIELTDFTLDEAEPLEKGLGGGGDEPDTFQNTEKQRKSLLRRILHWTGGHPYLTQRFCQAVAESGNLRTDADIDALCDELFLSPRARERDDNLIFVRDRMLRSEADHVALLDLYGMVCAGKRVKNDETNPLVSILLLSGIVRAVNGRLVVRNRIYAQVFNAQWVEANTPAAEVLRQRKAFRLGVLRTAAVLGSLILVIGGLSAVAIKNARRAERSEATARQQAVEVSRLLYVSNLNLLQREWESNNVVHIAQLLEETRNSPKRGFEWDYWNRLAHRSTGTFGYEDGVFYAAALSHDSTLLATSDGRNERMTVWNMATRQPLFVYKIVKDAAMGFSFTRDRKRLFATSMSSWLTVWDIATGQTVMQIPRPVWNSYICGGSLSPDDTRFVMQTMSKVCGILDSRTGQLLLEIPCSGEITGLAWTRDGKSLLLGFTDGSCLLCDAVTGKIIRLFPGSVKGIVRLAVAPDGLTFAASALDGSIALWNIATSHKSQTLTGPTDSIVEMAFSSDAKRLAGGCRDGTLDVWDLATGEMTYSFKESKGMVSSVHWLPDNRHLIITARDGMARIFDVSKPRETPTFTGEGSPLWSVAFRKNDPVIAVSDNAGFVHVWDSVSGREILTLKGHKGRVTTVTFSHNLKYLLTAGDDYTVRLWDAKTGEKIRQFKGHTGIVNAAIFSRDDTFVITGSNDKSARMWDTQTGKELHQFLGHTLNIECLALTLDGKRLVTGGDDRMLRVWDVATQRELLAVPGNGEVWGLAIFPDGKRVVSGNLSNTALIWDMETGKILKTLTGHTNWVTQVAISKDGKRILTGSRDKTAKLWDADSGSELLTLRGHQKQVSGVAFSEDGNSIATASADGTARIWSRK